MKPRFNIRAWHAWFSVVLAIPLLLIALTAILITHAGALGLRQLPMDASWLPGYPARNTDDPLREARTWLPHAEGLWVGTRAGLFDYRKQTLQAVPELAGQEIRALLAVQGATLALTQQGLWRHTPQGWSRNGRAPVLSAFVVDGVLYAVLRERGLQRSDDAGRHWQAPADLAPALAALPAEALSPPLTAARVVRDLHTGEALLGHDGEWVWVDLSAGVLLLLALSGIWMWWKGRRLALQNRLARAWQGQRLSPPGSP